MENQSERDYTEINLLELLYVIRDNARNIFVVTLCCVLLAAAYVFMQPKSATYTSEALVRVRQMPNILKANQIMIDTVHDLRAMGVEAYNTITPVGYGLLDMNQRFLTCRELLKSQALLAPVNTALGITGTVNATQVTGTEMMKILFSASDAAKAQEGNERLIKNFQEYVAKTEHTEIRYVLNDVAETQKAGDNSAVEAVVIGTVVVEIIDPPTFPTVAAATRNTKRTLAVSALLGILLGSGYAVMHYLMNRKITTRQDIEDYLSLPVLAVVPEEKSLAEAMARQNDESVWQKIGDILWKEN